LRNKLIAKEIIKLKPKDPNAADDGKPHLDLPTPITTNQETHCNEIHSPNPQLDKANYKRKTWLNSYSNSMFNAGVFVNPWQDGC